VTTRPDPVERLTVYVGESDRHAHQALYAEIIHRAHAAGLAGASAWKGFEGYGATARLHTARLLSLNEDLPVMVQIVDTTERIDAFLPQLVELGVEGLVLREPVTVVELGPPGTPA
jgi:PII-like signaling protein